MDSLYFFNVNYTAASNLGFYSNWNSVLFNTSNIIGGPLQYSMLNCYLFILDFEDYTLTRYNQFKDFTDLYTSFLFNLLSQSLQLKNYITAINNYQVQGNVYSQYETAAKIIRIILDFESSDASGYTGMVPVMRAAKLLKKHDPNEYFKTSNIHKVMNQVFKVAEPILRAVGASLVRAIQIGQGVPHD